MGGLDPQRARLQPATAGASLFPRRQHLPFSRTGRAASLSLSSLAHRVQRKPAPVTFPLGALRPRAPTWPSGSRARGSRWCNWCVCCALPADVSRCVAERKYTQEQARKELQQVFIPECNDDGTYSQVRPLALSGPRSVCSQLRGGEGVSLGSPCTAGKGVPGGADCHSWRWYR